MDGDSIKQITDNISEMLLKKNEDYGGASFDLGLNGNMVHLWDKVKRYKSLIGKCNKNPNFESIEDTLKDIIGYSIIGLHILSDETLKDKIHG
ncbi:MAG: DUF1599 domain-containing protein [Ignavibacteriae bacterium]|nr:DUF1599 domain-containing protein [Ignavibacteriota bacterium]